MTEQELAEIRTRADAADDKWDHLVVLRADQVRALLDHIAALREIAQAVADGHLFSESPGEAMLLPEVSARWVDKARALLGETKASEE